MNSDFLSTSTAISEEPDPLKIELERIKAKSAKDRAKIRELKKQISELTLKNQLLTEENKLLQTTRAQPQQEKPKDAGKMIPQARVSQVLSDFDSLLEQQSKEISELIADKDKLSAICFSSLTLLNAQENYITKFKAATQKLLRFVSKSGETIDSVARDFKSIGIDVSNDLKTVHRSIQVNSITSMLNSETSKMIDASEVEQIIQLIPQTQMNDSAMKVVVTYLTQQINATKEYERTINEVKKQKEDSDKVLSKLLYKIKPANQKKFSLQDAFEQIDALNKRSEYCTSLESMLSNLVDTFAAFGDKFDHDPDIQRCLGRIRFWIQTPSSDVDIVQEIDFLLGMCLTERKCHAVYYDSSSSEQSPSDYTSDSYCYRRKKTHHNKDIIRQIKEMKTTVCDMKGRLYEANTRKRCPY